MTPGLREVLELRLEQRRVLEQESDQILPWLFHKNGKRILSFRKAWSTACKNAGLAGCTPHDLRRTAVRNLERAGVRRSAAMPMVGRRTESIYRRYAIADEAIRREGAVKLAALNLADHTHIRSGMRGKA